MKPKPEITARSRERYAQIKAGLQGYTGHMSPAERESRLTTYYSVLANLDEEIRNLKKQEAKA